MAQIIRTAVELVPAIEHLLQARIAAATETVVQQAVQDFEAKLRREIASTAMEVSRFYEMSMQQDNLVIKVRVQKGSE